MVWDRLGAGRWFAIKRRRVIGIERVVLQDPDEPAVVAGWLRVAIALSSSFGSLKS